RAVDYASKHKRKTNSRRKSDNDREHSEHGGLRKQELSDLARARANRAKDRQLAAPFRNQNRERQKNPGDRNEERDGKQDMRHRKCLVEDFENAAAQQLIGEDGEMTIEAEARTKRFRH